MNEPGATRGVQLVWFKRDLRVTDHRPLASAARTGPCLCLYVYEPEVISAPDFDAAHLEFIKQSLRELDQALRERGGSLTLRVGAMPEVLDRLHQEHGIAAIWSHEETGNGITYARDRRVADWARRHRIEWHQEPGNGVIRRLRSPMAGGLCASRGFAPKRETPSLSRRYSHGSSHPMPPCPGNPKESPDELPRC